MSSRPPSLPPVRACIFDVDGLLINSEDIYTEAYNTILRRYGKSDLPWHIKAQLQSGGSRGNLLLISWAQLPLSLADFKAQVAAQHDLFRASQPLPGVSDLLRTLSIRTAPRIHLALASSSSASFFDIKTSHLPVITTHILPSLRVFGDDPDLSAGCGKPAPDIFLLALRRVNEVVPRGEEVRAEECLVFEDSVAGVTAARRAGMRAVWVPHPGLRAVRQGREEEVLMGQMKDAEEGSKEAEGGTSDPDEESRMSSDGWAEMRSSLEGFPYERYGIRLEDLGEGRWSNFSSQFFSGTIHG